MEWFASLNFLNLAALGLLPFVPVLLVAYLRQRTKLKRVVSSTFILKQLPEKTRLKRKLQLPLRFFLELAALLLIIAAALWPILEQKESRVALVIDNSLSMQAISGVGSPSQTRFQLAQQKLYSWIEENGENSQFAIFSVAPKLKKIRVTLVSPSRARRLLNDVSIIYTADARENARE